MTSARYRICHREAPSSRQASAVGEAVLASEKENIPLEDTPVRIAAPLRPALPAIAFPRSPGAGKKNWQGNVGQGNENRNPIPLPKIPLPPFLESAAESSSVVIAALLIAAASAGR